MPRELTDHLREWAQRLRDAEGASDIDGVANELVDCAAALEAGEPYDADAAFKARAKALLDDVRRRNR